MNSIHNNKKTSIINYFIFSLLIQIEKNRKVSYIISILSLETCQHGYCLLLLLLLIALFDMELS